MSALEGVVKGTSNALCYRCGGDPDDAHDRLFCPAFSNYGEAGHWIPFATIARELRKLSSKTISIQSTCRVEEHDGPAATWHDIVGFSVDGKYVVRFDAPFVPEFSIWDSARGNHRMLYQGWRGGLRAVCAAADVKWRHLARALKVNSDHTTEEIARFQSSFL